MPKKVEPGAAAPPQPLLEDVVYINVDNGTKGNIYFTVGDPLGPEGYEAPFLGAVPAKHPSSTNDNVVNAFILVPDADEAAALVEINTWLQVKLEELNARTPFIVRKNGTPVLSLADYDGYRAPFSPPAAEGRNVSVGAKWNIRNLERPSEVTKLHTFKTHNGSIVASKESMPFAAGDWPKGTRVYSILTISTVRKYPNGWAGMLYTHSAYKQARDPAPQVVPAFGSHRVVVEAAPLEDLPPAEELVEHESHPPPPAEPELAFEAAPAPVPVPAPAPAPVCVIDVPDLAAEEDEAAWKERISAAADAAGVAAEAAPPAKKSRRA